MATITDVQNSCTGMYQLLSGYLTHAAAPDGYTYFESNAAAITTAILAQSRLVLQNAVDACSTSPTQVTEIWDLVTICNAAVQDTLSVIDAKNQSDKNPSVVSSTGTIRWLLNTTTKR